MKFVHLSDLHLGKKLNGFSMLDDQKYILTKIINIIDNEQPDGVLIAGDVYDKPVPPAEAVEMFDDFLCRLAKRNLQVFVISGNHDSAERIAFGCKLMDVSGIHMSPVYDGKIKPFTMEDEFGKLNIYMLPFINPRSVRRFFEEGSVSSYTDAVSAAINAMNVNTNERNIIVSHQFVTGAVRSESEEISVGGTDNVDVTVYDKFDYVALGHIHGPQRLIRDTVRYCGTPLKYSFSEARHKKSVTVVELKEKGNVEVRAAELVPMHNLREIKGSYEELSDRRNYENTAFDDYIHITLTDENDIINAFDNLRVIYPNLMKLDYDNNRTRSDNVIDNNGSSENKTPFDLFSELYEKQNNMPLNEEQNSYLSNLIEKIWEERI